MSEIARELLKIVGQAGTMEILEFIRDHGTAQHLDLNAFTNTHTLNVRLRQLIRHRLIKHNYERHIPKKEWYTITEKGKKILGYMEQIMEAAEESVDRP